MAVLRNRLKEDFTIIANQAIVDSRLSPIEFRLYCYLCSRPKEWDINNTDIQKKLNIKSRGTLAKYWKKLMGLNLIIREKSKKENGLFTGYDYTILDYKPCINEQYMEPCINGTDTDPNRHGAIDTHSNTKYLNKTKSLNKTEGAQKTKRFIEPTLNQVKEDFIKKGSTETEAIKFHAYYASNGWKVGKNKMKNWNAAISGWIARNPKIKKTDSQISNNYEYGNNKGW